MVTAPYPGTTEAHPEATQAPPALLDAGHIRAELARRSHVEFIRSTWQKLDEDFIVGRHTRAIAARIDQALADFRRGVSTFLVVAVPFRHGKSDLVSRYLPPRFLGLFPSKEVMLATYSASLSHDFSRFGRALMQHPKYSELFPGIGVSAVSASVEHWELREPERGGMTAVGLGGGLAGRGYALGIVDDVLRNRLEAESKTVRDARWAALTNDFLTRRAPVSITLVVATPWHVDDPLGRIERQMAEDATFPRFEFLRFPAGDLDGEPLFPERFPDEWYSTQRATLGTYGAAGLLDCAPVSRGGNILAVDSIDICEEGAVPDGLRWGRGWDLASTVKQRVGDDPDYTVGLLGAVQELPPREGSTIPVRHIWVRDVRRLRAEAPERDRAIRQCAEEDGPSVEISGEAVAGYKDTLSNLQDALSGQRRVHKITPRHDLLVRCSAIEPIVEGGCLHIVRGPWNASLIEELQAFPGRHDDQLAALLTLWEGLTKRRRVEVT